VKQNSHFENLRASAVLFVATCMSWRQKKNINISGI